MDKLFLALSKKLKFAYAAVRYQQQELGRKEYTPEFMKGVQLGVALALTVIHKHAEEAGRGDGDLAPTEKDFIRLESVFVKDNAERIDKLNELFPEKD